MKKLQMWVQTYRFQVHLLSFVMMVLASVSLYWPAQSGAYGWIFGLLGVIILGNMITLLVS